MEVDGEVCRRSLWEKYVVEGMWFEGVVGVVGVGVFGICGWSMWLELGVWGEVVEDMWLVGVF